MNSVAFFANWMFWLCKQKWNTVIWMFNDLKECSGEVMWLMLMKLVNYLEIKDEFLKRDLTWFELHKGNAFWILLTEALFTIIHICNTNITFGAFSNFNSSVRIKTKNFTEPFYFGNWATLVYGCVIDSDWMLSRKVRCTVNPTI